MRTGAAIFALLMAIRAFAFDSALWLMKREAIGDEVTRLAKCFDEYHRKIKDPAENITIPIECWEDGAIKSMISAAHAQFFLNEGFVWGETVKVVQYDRDGNVEAEINADECLVDRNSKSGIAEGNVNAKYRKSVLKGEKVYFSFPEEYVKILSKPEIHTEDLEFKGLGDSVKTDAPMRSATIVSDRADYDRTEGVIMFDGSVRIDETQFKACADELFVFLEGTNDFRRLVARGDVAMTNETRYGSCEQLSYRKSDSMVTLVGGDSKRAKLVDDGERRSVIEGAVIRYWTDSEQVEIEDSVITIDGVDLGGKGGFKEIFGHERD